MKEEIKNRHTKRITVIIQSYNIERLVDVQQEIINFLASQSNLQELVDKEDYVWIDSVMNLKEDNDGKRIN